MTIYGMNPDAYQEARRTLRRRTLVIGPSLALIVSVLITVFQQSDEPLSAQTYATIFVFFFAIFGGGTVLITLLSGHRFDAAWRAFELTLDGDSLTVRQLGTNPISVQRSEVTSIQQTGSGDLAIRTASPWAITIPSRLEHFEDVRAALADWCPIQTASPHPAARRLWLLFLAAMIAFMATSVVRSLSLALALWLVGIGAFIYVGRSIVSAPGLTGRARITWIVLLAMFCLSIALRMLLAILKALPVSAAQ